MMRRQLFGFWQTKVILLTVLLCAFAPAWINDRPLMSIDSSGNWYFPAFGKDVIYEDYSSNSFNLFPPVPYGPGKSDFANSGFKSPFDPQFMSSENGKLTALPLWKRHWFGTDLRGSDVLSYTVYGLRNSLAISFVAFLISLILAALLGFSGGWYAGGKLKVQRVQFLILLLWIIFVIHGFNNLYSTLDKYTFLSVITGLTIFFFSIFKRKKSTPAVTIKIDFISDRLAELFIAIPRMILLLVLVQYFEKSVISLALVIGFTGWVDLARLIRSETIRLKDQPFVDAARMNGLGSIRLFICHILPNILPSLLVVAMYTLSGNIMVESSMSFLGLGLPPAQPSIGTLLSEARSYYEHWWLFVFPGCWLSILVYALFSLPGRWAAVKQNN